MTKLKKENDIELDNYEADLEENFDKAKPLSKKEKGKALNILKEASENYIKKAKLDNQHSH